MAADPRPPAAIRITRPYATEEEYLERELETLTRTGITLIGAQPRPEGAVLRFELALSSGQVLMRGEGRVTGYKAAALQGSGGLALRFTRLDLRSKALVDRAAALRDRRRSTPALPSSEPAAQTGAPASAPSPSVPAPPVAHELDALPLPLRALSSLSPTLAPPPFMGGMPTLRPDSLPPPLPAASRASGPARSSSQPPPWPWPAALRKASTPAPPRASSSRPAAHPAREGISGALVDAVSRAGAPAPVAGLDRAARTVRAPPEREALLERLRLRARGLDEAAVQRILASRVRADRG